MRDLINQKTTQSSQSPVCLFEEYQETFEVKSGNELKEVIDSLQRAIHKFVLLKEQHVMRVTFPRNTVTPVLQLFCQSVPTQDQKEIKRELDQITSTTGNAILLRYGDRIAEYLNSIYRVKYKHLKLEVENIKNRNQVMMVGEEIEMVVEGGGGVGIIIVVVD
ncbi:8149_t:CDS:2 [Ambispora gerdemannii]|uniref:8149_t:CDS:1 n=1 Tax=Ambispora gerdemannii TaxID=144530 RepID=A0A9N8ZH22_9GLOM|nr:8149_t:CDS:2 [Ambispora gerdemannii]